MTRVVICQDDARNTTGCGNGHLQDGDGEAIRSDCQARMATGHPNGMGRGNSKGKDRVKDCREHGSSGTGRDDLRGRQTPSPFLYMHSHESAHTVLALPPCPELLPFASGTGNLARTSWTAPDYRYRNQYPLHWRKSRVPWPPSGTLLHHFSIHRAVKSVKWTVCPSLYFICTKAKSVAECPGKACEPR